MTTKRISDKQRLDWLKARCHYWYGSLGKDFVHIPEIVIAGNTVRQAIDSAIKSQRRKG